jgi:indolepyruvate ferredoxin oxidoreductase alpha subunit
VTFPAAAPVQGGTPRPPILCAGCMHRPTFYAMRKVFRDGIFPSDIGCYTLGLQLGAVDTTICMGASITSGAASPGRGRSTRWSAPSATRRSCTRGCRGS